jgi:hypothetical protein
MRHVWKRGEHTGFWRGNVRVRDDVAYVRVDGRIILKSIFKNLDAGMEWIDLAQYRDMRLVIVNAKMNLRIP